MHHFITESCEIPERKASNRMIDPVLQDLKAFFHSKKNNPCPVEESSRQDSVFLIPKRFSCILLQVCSAMHIKPERKVK